METTACKRLRRQLAFLNEVERLKIVYRGNRTIDRSRPENSAEHSWHVALMALVLREYSGSFDLDIDRVVRMLLVHDLVEIYAGDTLIFDTDAVKNQAQREKLAADQLFALLPNDQEDEFRKLWTEFEKRESAEAVYAACIDALQPLTNHLLTGVVGTAATKVASSAILARKKHIETASPVLWQLTLELVAESEKKGLYCEG